METPSIKTPDNDESKPVFVVEWDGLTPLPKGATDAHLLEDADAVPFSWDVQHESPPRW